MPSATSAGRASVAAGAAACRPSPAPSKAAHALSAAESRMRAALRIGHRAYFLVGRSAQRQPHAEVRAGLAVTQQLDRAAVGCHALRDDGKPDARSAHGSALRPPALIKGLEDPIAVVGMHAGTIVADVHDEIVALH